MNNVLDLWLDLTFDQRCALGVLGAALIALSWGFYRRRKQVYVTETGNFAQFLLMGSAFVCVVYLLFKRGDGLVGY